MIILGIGESYERGALYYRLQRSGHEVRVHVQDSASEDLYARLLKRTADWRSELDWLRDGGDDALALFECGSYREWQDDCVVPGFNLSALASGAIALRAIEHSASAPPAPQVARQSPAP